MFPWFGWGIPAAADPAVGGVEGLDGIGAIEELALTDLLSLESDVSTRTVEEVREAPGVVTVLTADDLARAGCRDLLDALRLVPELEIGADTWNEVGLGVRGLWGGLDGKILFLLDGHTWNELNYGSHTLGNRLPIGAIERIEIVRGPGSAVYGGMASLAVVKITTRASAGSEEGVRASAASGWFDSGAAAHQTVDTTGSVALGERTRFGWVAAFGRGRRADAPWEPQVGPAVDFGDTRLDPALLGVGLEVGRWTVSAYGERYRTTRFDTGSLALDAPLDSHFTGLGLRTTLALVDQERITVTPRASYTWQRPFESQRGVAAPNWDYVRDEIERAAAGVDWSAGPADWLDVSGGFEGGLDRARSWWVREAPFTDQWVFGAGWLQGIARTPVVNLFTGVRYDVHGSYGDAVSPRVGLTRSWDRAHAKALIARGFRAPAAIQARSDVSAERGLTYELEGGLAPLRSMYLTGNLFHTQIDNPLIYGTVVDPVSGEAISEGYVNVDRVVNAGGGLNAAVRAGAAQLDAAWSTYVGLGGSDVFRVPGRPAAMLGLPNHKGVVRASVRPTPVLTVGGVATALSPRWSLAADGAEVRHPAALLLDAIVTVEPPGTGLGVSVSAHDLLDAAPPIAQPRPGELAPIPAPGRTFGLRVSWQDRGGTP